MSPMKLRRAVRLVGRVVEKNRWQKTLENARVIAKQKYCGPRAEVTPLDKDERTFYDEIVIGYVVCKYCEQKMQVLNKEGEDGLPLYDYITPHEDGNSRDLCRASGKYRWEC